MPTPGLSLVGFMIDQQQALTHLRMQCVTPDASDAALIAGEILPQQSVVGN